MAKSQKEDKSAIEVVKPAPLVAYDYGEDEGKGYEDFDRDDISIPFINLLQALSPIVVEGRPGAVAGAWYNTVTEQIYPKDLGFLFVPAAKRHYFIEWVPRDKGGGFVAHHEPDSDIVQNAIARSTQFGHLSLENGNDLQESFYVYGVMCDEEGSADSMGVLSFVKTKIKSYKNWMSRVSMLNVKQPSGVKIRPPLWSHLSRVKSQMKKNEKGQFYIPHVSSGLPEGMQASLLPMSDERFMMARMCKQLIDSGDVKIDPNQQNAQQVDDNGPAPF